MAIARKLLAVLLCMALFGCTSESVNVGEDSKTDEEVTKEVTEEIEEEIIEAESLLIWSYTDEILKEIEVFEELNNAQVTVEVMDMNGLVPMATGVIKAGLDMPDLLILEESQLNNPSLTPLLLDLESYGSEIDYITEMSPIAVEKGKTSEGKLIGLSYQISPVGIYYRRSMATKIFGSDDPAVISQVFSSYTNISQGLDLLNEANIKMFSDIFTLRQFANLNPKYIDETGLFIKDSVNRDYFELIKKAQFDKQVAFETEWSDLWLQGMYKPITNDYGENMDIFAYILPSWGLSNILMLTGESEEPILSNEDGSIQVFNPTSGDWGIASLTNPYSSGSSYMTVNNTSEHIDLSLMFMEYMCSNLNHDSDWLTNGDMVSSIPSIQMNQVFSEAEIFLGGQSFHQTMANISEQIKPRRYENKDIESKNLMIHEIFESIIMQFIQGEFHTIDEAIKLFETQVEEMYPELFIVANPE